MPTITVAAAAGMLGISRQRVAILCQAHEIGELISPRLRLLTAADVQRLRQVRRPPGRPAKDTGLTAAKKTSAAAKKTRRRTKKHS